jgi:divalent metal cation (Fe/Co/Zn/Cd) transporter
MEHTMGIERQQAGGSGTAKVMLYAAGILLIAEAIGSFTFKIGPGKVVLLPMIWALLLGAALGLASRRCCCSSRSSG